MKYKYILFDLDGTLTDPKEGITRSVAYALEAYGIKTDNLDDLTKFIGPPLIQSFEKYYGFSHKDAIDAVEKYRERFSVTGLFENEVYDDIPEMLQDLLDKGYILAVATSKPTCFSVRILEHFDLMKYFEIVIGSELNGNRTDKAEVIDETMRQLGIEDKSSVLMVGDREHDMIGAMKNDIDRVGALYGYGNEKEFTDNGAVYIAKDVKDLHDYIITH